MLQGESGRLEMYVVGTREYQPHEILVKGVDVKATDYSAQVSQRLPATLGSQGCTRRDKTGYTISKGWSGTEYMPGESMLIRYTRYRGSFFSCREPGEC
jgi:hypothetical protein